MRHIRPYSFLIIACFATSALFGEASGEETFQRVHETPSSEKSYSVDREDDVSATERLNSDEVEKRNEERTNKFLRGGFAIISVVLFAVGLYAAKVDQGQRA